LLIEQFQTRTAPDMPDLMRKQNFGRKIIAADPVARAGASAAANATGAAHLQLYSQQEWKMR
jgi:hypothetical protein